MIQSYAGFWTPWGMIRHLFFNSFHPVFPWTAFLLAGMWLGWQDSAFQKRILLAGVVSAYICLNFLCSRRELKGEFKCHS